jgi:heme/copper-type cytochrome/quinol oxidase subunit 2
MDGSENDGINIVLIAGFLVFLVVICGIIGGAIWLYRSRKARHIEEPQEED